MITSCPFCEHKLSTCNYRVSVDHYEDILQCKNCHNFEFCIVNNQIVYLRFSIENKNVCCNNLFYHLTYTVLDKIMIEGDDEYENILDVNVFLLPKSFDKKGLKDFLNRLLDMVVFS